MKRADIVRENRLQFDMDSGLRSMMNHLRRGRGHLLAYMWNRFQWEYFPRMRIAPAFPLNVDIEVSSRCNLRCDHCFRQYMDIREDDLMPMAMYTKIIDECAEHGLFTLKFSMRGEPTLHPDIVEMVRYAKENGIKEVWVNTHGGTLTEKMAEGFSRAGLDILSVSFDGLGKVYESIRIPLKYEDTLAKLSMFAGVRKRLRLRKPLLKVQTLWSAIKEDPGEFLRVMEDIADKVSYNIDFDFERTHFMPDPGYVCYRLWQRICVTSVGDILKCPSDFCKEEVMGRFGRHTIKEIWDSAQEAERKRHLAGERLKSAVCARCHHGAKVVKNKKVYMDKEQAVNEVVFSDTYKGAGLYRRGEPGGGSA